MNNVLQRINTQICKELTLLNSRKTTDLIEKWTKNKWTFIETNVFLKENTKCPKVY